LDKRRERGGGLFVNRKLKIVNRYLLSEAVCLGFSGKSSTYAGLFGLTPAVFKIHFLTKGFGDEKPDWPGKFRYSIFGGSIFNYFLSRASREVKS